MNRKGQAQGRGHRFWRNRAGNVTPLFAVMLVPIVAMLGMAGETTSWFLIQRAAQNTADQAALAAASNNCAPSASCATNGTTYAQEAAAVARRYNFVNGSSDTTVVADTTTSPAVCASSTCYRVTIQRKAPISLLRVAGYSGTTTTGSGRQAVNVVASAVARRTNSDSFYCVTTVANDPQSFRVNGGPSLDLTSCMIFAPNGGARCNGTSGSNVMGADVGQSSGKPCGVERTTNRPLMDGFDSLKSNLKNTCGSNSTPQTLTSGSTYSISNPRCGPVTLTSNTTLAGDNVLLIENGGLDLKGYTLKATGSLTIIFSGQPALNVAHSVTGSGVLDYSAPTSGTWSGVALYQDPRLNKNQDFTYSGNSPTFNITGMIYARNADVTISGAINHATGGLACLTFFVNTLLVNGTGSIFATPTIDCPRDGFNNGQVQTLEKVVMVQ